MTKKFSRVSKGVPQGGEFANKRTSESEVVFTTRDDMKFEERSRLASDIKGYRPSFRDEVVKDLQNYLHVPNSDSFSIKVLSSEWNVVDERSKVQTVEVEINDVPINVNRYPDYYGNTWKYEFNFRGRSANGFAELADVVVSTSTTLPMDYSKPEKRQEETLLRESFEIPLARRIGKDW